MPASVFISHSSYDDRFVEMIATDLAKKGIRVWVDHNRIRAGDNFISRIEEGLVAATHVLIILSPHSLLSQWVREERNTAQLLAIEGSKRLIPILTEGFSTEQIPLLLRGRIYIDFNKKLYPEIITMLAAEISETGTQSDTTHRPELQIDQIGYISELGGQKVALEAVIANPTSARHSLREASIESWTPRNLGIHYGVLPPTESYHLDLRLRVDHTNANEIDVTGTAAEEGSNWGRPLRGAIYMAPYFQIGFVVSFPLTLEIQPNDNVIVRFIFDKISVNKLHVKRTDKLRPSADGGMPLHSRYRFLLNKDTDLPEKTNLILRGRDDIVVAAETRGAFVTPLLRNAALPS